MNVEIDTLNTHLVTLERLKALEIAELRTKLENSNNYTIESIRNTHNNYVDALQTEIEDLKGVID